MFHGYLKQLQRLSNVLYSKKCLIWTNTATGVLSITIGDVIQQNIEHHLNNSNESEGVDKRCFVWDQIRTRNMSIAGVYFSLFGHWWYSFLDRKFPPKTRNAVRSKILAEAITGPILVSSVFFLVCKIRGQSLSQSWENIVSNFWIICNVEWLVYLPLQWLNFKYIPASYRYLYVASISLGYDAFLSYIIHRETKTK